MTTSVVCSPLYRLTPIGLAELNEKAALQTRVDRKYVLPAREVAALLAEVEPDTRVLEIKDTRSFSYESVYFDTPDLNCYLLTACRRRRRFKIRTRSYLDSELCWLEVKTRGPRGSTIKDRLRYQPDDRARLAPGRWFVNLMLSERSIEGGEDMTFTPTLVTRYHRSTLYLPSTNSRVTIDTNLAWADEHRRLRLDELVIMETKTGSTASCVDRLLWARGYRATQISKYATGLAALRPDLPAVRWRRTLRQHFGSGTMGCSHPYHPYHHHHQRYQSEQPEPPRVPLQRWPHEYDRPEYERPEYDRPEYERPEYDRHAHDRHAHERYAHERHAYERHEHETHEYAARGYERHEVEAREFPTHEYQVYEYEQHASEQHASA